MPTCPHAAAHTCSHGLQDKALSGGRRAARGLQVTQCYSVTVKRITPTASTMGTVSARPVPFLCTQVHGEQEINR